MKGQGYTNRKERVRVILIVVAVMLAIGTALAVVHLWEERQKREEGVWEDPYADERPMVRYDGAWYGLREGVESYLLIGIDKFEDTLEDPDAFVNSQQADFLLLVVVDEHAGRYEVLQLNRDTMTEIQRLGLGGGVVNTFTGQLALSHTYGSGDRDSCRNTVQAVSTLLYDVPIDHYVSVPMDAVPLLNDLVGGVRLRIEDDFSAVDPSLIRGTEVTLHGQQALTYVRARGEMEDPTNLSRMVRQRQYLRALGDKMREAAKADEDFALRAVLELSNGLVSDCTAQELAELANTLAEYPAAEVRTVDGEARVGERFMEFYPDEDALQAQVIDLYFERTQQD